MQFIKIKIQTKKQIRLPGLDRTWSHNLLLHKSRANPLSYEAQAEEAGTVTVKTNVIRMAPDRLRCGVAKFTQKSTRSSVTIHFRTWVPYLTLLPTPTPTRENFLVEDFPTTLYCSSSCHY